MLRGPFLVLLSPGAYGHATLGLKQALYHPPSFTGLAFLAVFWVNFKALCHSATDTNTRPSKASCTFPWEIRKSQDPALLRSAGVLLGLQWILLEASPKQFSQGGNGTRPPLPLLPPQPNQIHLETQRAWPPFTPPIHLNYLDRPWGPAQVTVKLSQPLCWHLSGLDCFWGAAGGGIYPRWHL